MPSWKDELATLLYRLGVVFESQSLDDQTAQETAELADWTCYQHDPRRAGVLYRLDLFGVVPEVRILLPSERNLARCQIYLVTLTPGNPLPYLYASLDCLRGSPGYEHARDTFSYGLWMAYCELMKALFWQGDLGQRDFPPEITVRCLVE